MKPKARIMAELRERREAAGLVRVEVHVRPEHKARLAAYVRTRLDGECSVRTTPEKRAQEP